MKAHAIMMALPYQGHLTPFVDLAIKLASKGITVTFVNTQHAHNQIAASRRLPSHELDIFADARASGLQISYATISDGFPLDFDRDRNFIQFWEFQIREFPSIAAQFVADLIASSDPSSTPFLVADTFSTWHATVARKHNLIDVSFWTEPAVVFAIDYHLHLLTQNGHYPLKDDEEHLISYIPGVELISTKDLMSQLQEADITTPAHYTIYRAFEEVRKADFVLHNTVQELEPHTLSALNQIHPTYAIGPINFSNNFNVPKNLVSQLDCTTWLDSRPPGSVLYVSFGSIAQTNREVIREIAQGLLLSGVSFIWAIRPQIVRWGDADDDAGVLPVGFEEDVGDRGLVVSWCNQLSVLSSPAVGGFLTHCGWNSILESIWYEVPMICYPIIYDQPTNRKLVVDDWKIGINLCDGGSIKREEVTEKINKLMSVETLGGIEKEMKKVRSKIHEALTEDGSSNRNLDQFLKDLNHKMQAKQEKQILL